MSKPERTSLELFRLKKSLDTLAKKEGRGTELVSLYVPPGKQISEVLGMLRDEYGTASNIKSDTTRKNVQDAIVKVQQRLKLFKHVPKNGLVIFSGAIPQNGPGSERLETYVLEPLEPIKVYLYRCDAKFHLEYLQEQLREKEAYGIILMDANGASFALLKSKHLEVVQEITSGVPGKHRAGGQSARRFERQREAKLQEFFNRVGKHANEIFLQTPNLKGVILGGPGPTKYDFEKGDYLQYNLKDKIIAILDTAYVGEQGVDEIMERAPEILRKVRYIEEKKLMQDFLYQIGHDTGLAAYGEDEIRRALNTGAVRMLLLSEGIDIVRVTTKCSVCGYTAQETMKEQALRAFEQNLPEQHCPKCNSQSLAVAEVKDIVEELAEIAEHANTEVEMISTETEEGQMLKNSFGGMAAVLRFKLSR
ncbi:MAG TPA: peptide chain release factor aRF-1 [Candidatus Krumholzibacteriaceae bacterium]|nr:peptide chain release factor aRF-1 [Candidatus Krumholzibacteriaceae bacterium]